MKVFIQNEAGSFVKNLHDEKTLQPVGKDRVSRAYPFPYGFVPDTTTDDGLNADCFVITKTHLQVGQTVECDPVGLMEQFENGKCDHNILAVIRGEKSEVNLEVRDILAEFVSHAFDHVAGKNVKVGDFLDREAALRYLAQHEDAK